MERVYTGYAEYFASERGFSDRINHAEHYPRHPLIQVIMVNQLPNAWTLCVLPRFYNLKDYHGNPHHKFTFDIPKSAHLHAEILSLIPVVEQWIIDNPKEYFQEIMDVNPHFSSLAFEAYESFGIKREFRDFKLSGVGQIEMPEELTTWGRFKKWFTLVTK